MKTIKFRIWNGTEMVYDVTVGKFGVFYVNPEKGDGLNPEDTASLSVNTTKYPEGTSVMQFTGLLDKNGKEIYEGDLLRTPAKDKWADINYSCYEVFFHDGDRNSDYNIGYSMGRCHHHGAICGGYVPAFKPETVSKMIIIGSIYENPELLTK